MNRSQSSSSIPRLLKQDSYVSKSDLRSPSPVKLSPGSKIPVRGGETIYHGRSAPNLSTLNNNDTYNIKSFNGISLPSPNEKDSSGMLLEEMLLPSSPISQRDNENISFFNNDSSYNSFDPKLEKQGNSPATELMLMEVNKENDKLNVENVSRLQIASGSSINGYKSKNGKAMKDKDNVIYITENLIKKVSKSWDLKDIKTLHLSVFTRFNRRIQFIENLGGLTNLEYLDLSNNIIQKIQNLQHLQKLKVINLSNNQIKSLDGLEVLNNLEKLQITHNEISTIPNYFGQKMMGLTTIDIRSNNIMKLKNVTKLSNLCNLAELDMSENPCCGLDHFFEFTIFHLRTLKSINKKVISKEHRDVADHRFSSSEISNKEQEITQLKSQNLGLNNTNNELMEVNLHLKETKTKLSGQISSFKKTIRSVNEELRVKNDLLESKTTELNKASEKQFRLEQELVFLKLDAKFDEMWQIPDEEKLQTTLDSFNENPYIGKARYQLNNITKESIILTNEQSIRFASFICRLNHDALKKNHRVIQALEKMLPVNMSSQSQEIEVDMQKLKIRLTDDLNAKTLQEKTLKSSINEIEEKIRASKVNSLHSESQINALKIDIENGTEPNTKLLGKIEDEHYKNMSHLDELQKAWNEANTELLNSHQKCHDIENKLNKVITVIEKEKEMSQEIAALKEQVGKDSLQCSKLTEENKQLKYENSKLADNSIGEKRKWSVLEQEYQHNIEMLEASTRKSKESQKKEKGHLEQVRILVKEKKKLQEENTILQECDHMKHKIEHSNEEDKKVLEFLKSLTQQMIQQDITSEVHGLDDISMDRNTILVDLKVATLQYQNFMKEQLKQFEIRINEVGERKTYLENENSQLRENTKLLKEKLDALESTERMRKHEYVVLKRHLKATEEMNLKTIKDYDDIASEMKDQLEILEINRKKTEEDLQHKENELESGKKTLKDMQKKGSQQAEQYVSKISNLETYIEKLRDSNNNLTEELSSAKKQANLLRKETCNLKEKFAMKMKEKEEEHNNDLKKLFSDIDITKEYITSLQEDINSKIKYSNRRIQQMKTNIKNLEELLKECSIEQEKVEEVKLQMKSIKNSLRIINKELGEKWSMENSIKSALLKIGDLEINMNSRKNSNDGDSEITTDVNRKLVKALAQIDNVKNLLERKQQQLDSSNIPNRLITLQQKEISKLMKDLNNKEKEFERFKETFSFAPHTRFRHQRKEDFEPMLDDAKNTDDRMYSEELNEPHNIYHHHHFPDTNPKLSDSFLNNSHQDLLMSSDLSRRHQFDEIDQGTRRSEQRRSDLRWNLNRLEAKVGDAVLHRSLHRSYRPET